MQLGLSLADAQAVTNDIRRRGRELPIVQVNEYYYGRHVLMHRNALVPEPLTTPRKMAPDPQQ